MLTVNFKPFPELTTDRLLLRQPEIDDAAQIFIFRSNPTAMQYIPRAVAQTVADAEDLVGQMNAKLEMNEGINWAITMKDDPKLIGIIGFVRMKKEHFRAEIGYILNPDFHRTGIVFEALHAVIRYGFDVMKLHSIEAIVHPDNVASAKLLEKAGFVKEAHLKESEFYNGQFVDIVIYSLLTDVYD